MRGVGQDWEVGYLYEECYRTNVRIPEEEEEEKRACLNDVRIQMYVK